MAWTAERDLIMLKEMAATGSSNTPKTHVTRQRDITAKSCRQP